MKHLINKTGLVGYILFFILIPCISTLSQETRDIKNFNSIRFSIGADLNLKQGNDFMVKIEGEADDIKKIITLVKDNTLIIKKDKLFNTSANIIVSVTLPELKNLYLSGSGDIRTEGTFSTNKVILSVSGSGNIFIANLRADLAEVSVAGSGNLNVNKLTVNSVSILTSGSGDIYLAGECDKEADLTISGSGDINTDNFKSNTVRISISGSGNAKVYAVETLKVTIAGSGDVYYKGKPLVNSKSAGSGKTRPL